MRTIKGKTVFRKEDSCKTCVFNCGNVSGRTKSKAPYLCFGSELVNGLPLPYGMDLAKVLNISEEELDKRRKDFFASMTPISDFFSSLTEAEVAMHRYSVKQEDSNE